MKGAFSTFKAQRKKAEEALTEVMARRNLLEAEEEYLHASPVSKNDFIEALCKQVGGVADMGRERLRRTVLAHKSTSHVKPVSMISAYDLSWMAIRDVMSGKAMLGPGGVCAITAADPDSRVHGYPFDGVAMCMILEDQIKTSLRANLGAIEWPYHEAQSAEQRTARLQEIAAERALLDAQEEQLAEMLAEAIAG